MDITIQPGTLTGEVLVPSSKSILHRGLICAALAPGKSVIHRLYLSRDIQATMDCLTALGASFTRHAANPAPPCVFSFRWRRPWGWTLPLPARDGWSPGP